MGHFRRNGLPCAHWIKCLQNLESAAKPNFAMLHISSEVGVVIVTFSVELNLTAKLPFILIQLTLCGNSQEPFFGSKKRLLAHLSRTLLVLVHLKKWLREVWSMVLDAFYSQIQVLLWTANDTISTKLLSCWGLQYSCDQH